MQRKSHLQMYRTQTQIHNEKLILLKTTLFFIFLYYQFLGFYIQFCIVALCKFYPTHLNYENNNKKKKSSFHSRYIHKSKMYRRDIFFCFLFVKSIHKLQSNAHTLHSNDEQVPIHTDRCVG